MNTVQPIKEKDKVIDIFEYLAASSKRNGLMFAMGIYTGLRISDILEFRVRDVIDKDYISMREMKTGKEKRIYINKFIKKLLADYLPGKQSYEFLFPSPKDESKHLTRQQAYNILTQAGNKFGIEAIGTHTMRKTFGFMYYKKTKDVAMLMELFNHSSVNITLRYIGVIQDTKDQVYKNIDILG